MTPTVPNTSHMPEMLLHLGDILQATEEATITIIDAANHIGSLLEAAAIAPELKEQIGAQAARIYVACGFENLNGQRIKKIIDYLNGLQDQLPILSPTPPPETAPSLLNGPQLTALAPAQQEIDALFTHATPPETK